MVQCIMAQVCVCACVVCVCVCERACVFVCVCVWERERERKRALIKRSSAVTYFDISSCDKSVQTQIKYQSVSKIPVSSLPNKVVPKFSVLCFWIQNATTLNFTFHTTCRKFQHFPLLSVTALCSEKRAYLVFVNEGIHRSWVKRNQLDATYFIILFNAHSMLNMFRPLIRPSSGVCD